MAFARGVLLVEGDGDRLFFEFLRRRLAKRSTTGDIDQLYAVPTEGKTAFSQWLRLLSSYGRDGNRPVTWLAAPDSDAASEIREAWIKAGLSLPPTVTNALIALAAIERTHREQVLVGTRVVNNEARKAGVGLELLTNGLEQVMLSGCSEATVARLCAVVGAPECAEPRWRPGCRTGRHHGMRAAIARETPWDEISAEAKSVMTRWLTLAMPAAQARESRHRPRVDRCEVGTQPGRCRLHQGTTRGHTRAQLLRNERLRGASRPSRSARNPAPALAFAHLS